MRTQNTCAHCGTAMPRKRLTGSLIYRGKLVCRNPLPCIDRKSKKDGESGRIR